MNGRLAISSSVLLLLLAATLPPGRARAEPPRSADREARERSQRADLAFNVGKFSDALAEYQAAYESKPLPAFLFNIAQCHRNMRNYEEARFFYRRYLALAPKSPDRATVEDLIAEMTRNLDRAQGRPTAETTASTPPPTAPPPLFAAASGQSSGAQEPGGTPNLLAAQAAGAPAPAPAQDREGRPVYRRWWFWTAVGVVATGAIATAVIMSRDAPVQGTLPPIDGRLGH